MVSELVYGFAAPSYHTLLVMDLHYEDIRRDYGRRSLSRKDLTDDPFSLVRLWLQEAVDDPKAVSYTHLTLPTTPYV